MLREEIIQKISQYFKLTEQEAEKVFLELFSSIVQGVKKDNIVDVVNFGEFVIRYTNGKNSGNGGQHHYKKSIEFLPSPELEEEIKQDVNKDIISETPEKAETPESDKQKLTEGSIPQEKPAEISDSTSVEDEIRRKREEILKKISSLPAITEEEKTEFIYEKKEQTSQKIDHTEEKHEDKITTTQSEQEKELKIIEDQTEEKEFEGTQNVYHLHTEEEPKEKVTESETGSTSDSLEQPVKSFNDYFEEVKKEIPQQTTDRVTETPPKPETPVIPKTAVELHNEITGSAEQRIDLPPPPVLETKEEPVTEPKTGDESYYIWYKDAESSESETQTMSYEYELLYQAAKEAEYKSKLKVYVSSFIVFFSLVLILLIFSPLIYKYFFTSADTEFDQTTTQDIIRPETNKQQEQTQQQPVIQQSPTQEQPQQTQQTQPEQNVQKEQQPQQQPQQQTQVPPTQQSQTTEPTIEGLVKNSMGWTDEKLKVIYIKLENGKYTIQESAWDSDAKAQKRVNSINGLKISGLNGTYVKADLGDKGIWYRTRFGEFTSIEEAREKAKELRSKEGLKLHALLLSIFLYA